uniref:Uncharacterized protein n=1 Tax=Helianthus annuus TaxID=4232 RepID=A0A251VGQ8_HELAN
MVAELSSDVTDYCSSLFLLYSFSSDEPFNLLSSCILVILFDLGLPPSSKCNVGINLYFLWITRRLY